MSLKFSAEAIWPWGLPETYLNIISIFLLIIGLLRGIVEKEVLFWKDLVRIVRILVSEWYLLPYYVIVPWEIIWEEL